MRAFYEKRYGVSSMEQSQRRIVEAGLGAPPEQPLVVLAHSGPSGLGKKHFDICGVDWWVLLQSARTRGQGLSRVLLDVLLVVQPFQQQMANDGPCAMGQAGCRA